MKNLDVHVILKLGVFVTITVALVVLAALKVIPGMDAMDAIKALGMTLMGSLAVMGGATKIASAMSSPQNDIRSTMRMVAPLSRDSQRSTPPGVLTPTCPTCGKEQK